MRPNGFSIVNVAVAVFMVMVFVAIVLPMLGGTRREPAVSRMQNSTQLRGIHQGLVTYANSNKQWFPGINELGEDERITVEQRFQILIEEDYFTPEYAISPSETGSITEWEGWSDEDAEPVTAANYSFAMLQIPQDGGRRADWSQSLNSQAIVVSDRNTGTKDNPLSIHIDPGEPWAGSVLWNDNHVAFENAGPEFETKYGSGVLNEADHLFESPGTDDALMVHAGN